MLLFKYYFLLTQHDTKTPKQQQKMALTSSIVTFRDESGASTGARNTGGAPPADTIALVAGAHVPILHLTTLLPAPTGDVAKLF